jgi:hypothetical protein
VEIIQTMDFYILSPCTLLAEYRHPGGMCRLHVQGRSEWGEDAGGWGKDAVILYRSVARMVRKRRYSVFGTSFLATVYISQPHLHLIYVYVEDGANICHQSLMSTCENTWRRNIEDQRLRGSSLFYTVSLVR